MLKINFKKFADLCLALAVPAAVALSSCSDNDITSVDGNTNSDVEKSNLTTVKLATFNGDASRITYGNGTRAEGDVLSLVATIANPSKAEGFNFSKEDSADGRYMSATSVYYNVADGKYYVTYHMQGNNYNTKLDTETAGAIQEFSFNEKGELVLGTGFRAAKPGDEDFDFNHIYFDVTDKRIIVAGHNMLKGNKDNTNAIIGVFNPTDSEFKYATVKTNEKIEREFVNEDNKNGNATVQLVDYADAGDVNCVIRGGETMNPNHTYGFNFYILATRKGMAVVTAGKDDNELFKPVYIADKVKYFIPTPGSAKFVAKTGVSSYFDLLYLAENKPNDSYSTTSKAKIAHFSIQTGTGSDFGYLMEKGTTEVFDPQAKDILNHGDQTELPAVISPIDGKNTLLCAPDTYNDKECYAALGTSGMYYKFNGVNSGNPIEGVVTFGNRPVNCVTADVSDQEKGHDGFIYVANGAKLTILHRKTFEKVASYNIPAKDANGNDVASSANYIHVQKAPANNWAPRERIITVAFGQEGVKVFKFNPALLEAKTVWEKELPTNID